MKHIYAIILFLLTAFTVNAHGLRTSFNCDGVSLGGPDIISFGFGFNESGDPDLWMSLKNSKNSKISKNGKINKISYPDKVIHINQAVVNIVTAYEMTTITFVGSGENEGNSSDIENVRFELRYYDREYLYSYQVRLNQSRLYDSRDINAMPAISNFLEILSNAAEAGIIVINTN
jgi:hypothetical protein